MEIGDKLAVLADAAKYDASCASSGSKGRRSRDGRGIGSTEGMGICHSYTPDGRCVSLLKILLTNYCQYDCLYCINRRSSDVRRARFTPEEVVRLTLDFYRRNYIEGLFLSSGIFRSPDHTMEQLVRVARTLRVDHGFHGYIHLKTIPHAAPELLAEAGRWADRLSINVELPTPGRPRPRSRPTRSSSPSGAPCPRSARASTPRGRKRAPRCRRRAAPASRSRARRGRPPRRRWSSPRPARARSSSSAPRPSSDASILAASSELYDAHRLRRVYYSAFSPIPDSPGVLPSMSPPLVREHRLYQADWLDALLRLRRGRAHHAADAEPRPRSSTRSSRGRCATARMFPVDVNAAPKSLLLRIPGVGARSVERMLAARRWHRLRLADLVRLRVAISRATPFVVTADHNPDARLLDSADLRDRLLRRRAQLELFAPRRRRSPRRDRRRS